MKGQSTPNYAHPLPTPDGSQRHGIARNIRKHAAQISRPAISTVANGECEDFAGTWPTNFSKGLPHDKKGIVDPMAFKIFTTAINSPDKDFDVPLGPETADGKHRPDSGYSETVDVKTFLTTDAEGNAPSVRGWESPVSGHVYDLEGPDAGSVGMAPAPRLGSDELAAEMAEDYAMALLRDVPFTAYDTGAADNVIAALNALPWFNEGQTVEGGHVGPHAARRRAARFVNGTSLSSQTLFRGSTRGAQVGPYLSQFLLQGTTSRRKVAGVPVKGPEEGLIVYGAQRVDQRVESHEAGIDYMTDWAEWLDVQNGANFKGRDSFASDLRFVTTPRDLATYVHFDALYQAYLNACLILLDVNAKSDRGLPEKNATGTRDAFATFGGPHILTLVTETATRSLKAVRRQKYNHHLRARPEAMGGIATLAANGHAKAFGKARQAAEDHLEKLRSAKSGSFSILGEIAARNGGTGGTGGLPEIQNGKNYLLPMAFPEGSPMHPAYGAGHATVAGSCTTMLKAFFEMYGADGVTELSLANAGIGQLYVPTADGAALEAYSGGATADTLTLQGELNKLAANISIGRNMAGVHYYSDYFDSLRMGERIAVGILMEQMLTYGEPMSLSFTSFDDDALVIRHDGSHNGAPVLEVNGDASAAARNEWFDRHVAALAMV